jgi:hypothetical protein
MRNVVFGIIGVLLGGLSILGSCVGPQVQARSDAYAAGQATGRLFGLGLFVAGIFAIVAGVRSEMPHYSPRPKKRKRKRPRPQFGPVDVVETEEPSEAPRRRRRRPPPDEDD